MFVDRKDAAEKLAGALTKYKDNPNVVVLGIPRGGAETAYYVAYHLHAELGLVVTRKLGYPDNPEAAFGAVAEDGSMYINPLSKNALSETQMKLVLLKEKEEITRRVKLLRQGKPLPEIKDKTIIIVDDGIATGATIFATIKLCKSRAARKIIVASPIAGRNMEDTLLKMVDEVVILEKPLFYNAVSQGYENFYNLSDKQALAFMNKWETEHHPSQH